MTSPDDVEQIPPEDIKLATDQFMDRIGILVDDCKFTSTDLSTLKDEIDVRLLAAHHDYLNDQIPDTEYRDLVNDGRKLHTQIELLETLLSHYGK